ncbi:MAG: hypothetical protein AAF533_27340 [Acidobacteriota bacterium]
MYARKGEGQRTNPQARLALHVDESGAFEGPEAGGYRVVTGVLSPALSASQRSELELRCLEIARELTGRERLAALHAGASRRPNAWKDHATRELLQALHSVLPERACLDVVALSARGPSGEGNDRFISPAFSANRYGRQLIQLLHLACCHLTDESGELSVHVGSRVFPAPRDELAALEALGHRPLRHRERLVPAEGARDHVLVSFGNTETLRVCLQQVLIEAVAQPRLTVTDLQVTSIRRSSDPRFLIADFVSNALWRHRGDPGVLDGSQATTCHGLESGPALDALLDALDAARSGRPVVALQAATRHRQPPAHAPFMNELLACLLAEAPDHLVGDPTAHDHLLELAAHLIDAHDHARLDTGEAAARLVSDSAVASRRQRRRAHALLLSVANHRGNVSAALQVGLVGAAHARERPRSLPELLENAELENRRAVTSLNAFDFTGAWRRSTRVARRLQRGLIALLGPHARERVLGHLHGTRALAAGHRGRHDEAREALAAGRRQLGDDPTQAAFAAHLAWERDDRRGALRHAERALPDADWRCRPLELIERALGEHRPFDAWLVLKLLERGWLRRRLDLEPVLRTVHGYLDTSPPTHPSQLIALSLSRLAAIRAATREARELLERGSALSLRPDQGALALLRLQLVAHSCLLGSRGDGVFRLRRGLAELLDRQPWARRRFGPRLRGLESDEITGLKGFLSEFTYLHR